MCDDTHDFEPCEDDLLRESANYWDDVFINGSWDKRAEIVINSFSEVREMLIEACDDGVIDGGLLKICGLIDKIEANIDLIRSGSSPESRKIVNDFLSGKYVFRE